MIQQKQTILAYAFLLLILAGQSHSLAEALTPQSIAEHRESLVRLLYENILPFWHPVLIDDEHGGYAIHLDNQGNRRAPGDKGIVTQARCLWFYAYMVNTGFGDDEHVRAARRGFEFLRDAMWDAEHGGFYWAVNHEGDTPTVPQKHLYGQAFALYALSEYALASGDPDAEALARELFAVIEAHAYDRKYGGYREFFASDWSEPTPGIYNPMGERAPDVKLMNTHLHLMEAMTVYVRVDRSALARERLLELITIQSNTVVRKTVGACTDEYQRDWTPLTGPQYDIVSYGHDVENVWLLMEAIDQAGMPQAPYMDLYRTLFDYSLRYGFDHESGGFYDAGPLNRPATSLRKTWWVQAEGLVGALLMYIQTHDKTYLECFEKTLEWIVDRQADWEHGDWFSDIHPDGEITGGKAHLWKSPYHNGRAVIRCLLALDALERQFEWKR